MANMILVVVVVIDVVYIYEKSVSTSYNEWWRLLWMNFHHKALPYRSIFVSRVYRVQYIKHIKCPIYLQKQTKKVLCMCCVKAAQNRV